MRPHLALIEDDRDFALMCSSYLERAGFAVTWAMDARAGKSALYEGRVDLAVLDLGLPDGSGLELLRALRSTSRLPVIVVPGRGAEADRVAGMEIDLFVRAREIREVNEQLSRANADLDAAGRRLREEQRAKDGFIATLSHELRNPLAAATAATELLALDMPDGHPALSVLERQLGTLARMSNDLLDGTRAVTGRLELVCEPVDVRSVVDGACADIRGLFRHAGRGLDVRLPAEPLVVDGDRLRLAQVLTNLLSNALKYTRPGGHTDVELAPEDGRARLTVRDDGIGFDPGQAEELFGVFMRAAPAGPDAPEGLGLGLSVVRTVVELHDGTITAYSDGPGKGASFTVALPTTDSEIPPPPRPVAAPHHMSVLIVEDNTDLAATYRTLLERQGHHVTAVHTGTDALTATEAHPFDVVLCDLGLPDIDGYAVTRALHARPDGERLRLIAVSGFSQGTDRALSPGGRVRRPPDQAAAAHRPAGSPGAAG